MPEDAGASWITLRSDGVRLAVKVTPRASSSVIDGVKDDGSGKARLAVRVSAPPEAGKANGELIRLLAKCLGVARGKVRVVSGASGRRKILHVMGAPEDLLERVATIAQNGPKPTGGAG